MERHDVFVASLSWDVVTSRVQLQPERAATCTREGVRGYFREPGSGVFIFRDSGLPVYFHRDSGLVHSTGSGFRGFTFSGFGIVMIFSLGSGNSVVKRDRELGICIYFHWELGKRTSFPWELGIGTYFPRELGFTLLNWELGICIYFPWEPGIAIYFPRELGTGPPSTPSISVYIV